MFSCSLKETSPQNRNVTFCVFVWSKIVYSYSCIFYKVLFLLSFPISLIQFGVSQSIPIRIKLHVSYCFSFCNNISRKVTAKILHNVTWKQNTYFVT